MTSSFRFRAVDVGRRRAELTVEQLWLRVVGLGGFAGLLELEAYLSGLMPLPEAEQDVLAIAVNERLDELLRAHRVPHRVAPPPAAGQLTAVAEQLLAVAAAGPDATVAGERIPVAGVPPSARAEAAGAVLSAALQRSLLTDPVEPDALQIRVRYRPAADDIRIGGDWYDAFRTADGATCLVVGDVAGHDRNAAVGMAQVRNLLRGVAYTMSEPPGAVLAVLDRALRDLAVGALATAVLARVEQSVTDRQAGRHRLRWSNAGHPPPLLLAPDGTVRLLQAEPDLMLGIHPDAGRGEHALLLPVGATVLFYTDGLVERRGADLDTGLAWLSEAARRLGGVPLDELCDALLAQTGPHVEDDIALLALRTPALAG